MEQETHLTLQEHDDDDDENIFMRFFLSMASFVVPEQGFSIRRECANSWKVFTFDVVCYYFTDTSIILNMKEKDKS